MASSSIHKSFKYDVFLSFRGEDTRTRFIDHLYRALQQMSILTYKDDERITKGRRISDELIDSIENSKFYIIVFSKNYASSSWCLDELMKIMECHKMVQHTAYPVFYDVEPSEVRKQSGAVEEALAKHGKEKEEVVGKWREALKEAADLAGWELKNTADRNEAKFIQTIVERISLELRSMNICVDEKLVGMETRVKDVISCLGAGINDVRVIGIRGIGGGGKTTLARAVYDQISLQFEGKSFVENVRGVSNASLSGLKSLQNQVLSDIFNDQSINVSGVYDGKNMMKRMMCGRKVLVVLDDVDHIDQLEALAGKPDWFKSGSRIIVTTRDEQVLIAHGVKLICKINLLSHKEAICLLSRYACGREIPVQGYEELSRQVIRYAAGLPLTIRVLGSFLCGKNDLEWMDALERLKAIPLTETLKKLELSYIGLDQDCKEIFLDVACILKGWSKDLAIQVLESRGLSGRNGLKILEQRSLIDIDDDECVGMHDHIVEMGKNIVRRAHPNKPNKHSRLWINKEIEDIFANNLGTKATRCILFYSLKLSPEIVMKGLRKMNELRFLDVSLGSIDTSISNWKFNNFPNALQYLRWNWYPFRSLPKTFQADNLVALGLAWSRIEQLWEGGEEKVLHKLKFLDLSYSMLRTFDLRLAPNLETLTLRKCGDLVKLHILVGYLKLRSVDLSFSKLRTLDLVLAPNLELLNAENCSDLVEFNMPGRCLNLRSLKLNNSKLRTLDIGLTPNLEYLDLRNCCYLEDLHMAKECWKLASLGISFSKLRTLDLGLTPNLERLDLRNCCYLEDLHMDKECRKLASLDISFSKLRTLDLSLTPNLKNLILEGCGNLKELHIPGRCLNLRSLILTNSGLTIFDIGLTPNLEHLDLRNCYDLRELLMSSECQNLTSLNISHSKLTILNLSLTPNLEKLNLEKCPNLRHAPIEYLIMKRLVFLHLSDCLMFRSFIFQIQYDISSRVTELHMTMEFLEGCRFHPNTSMRKFQFTCVYKEHLRDLLTKYLQSISSCGPCFCTSFYGFSGSMYSFRLLRKLELIGGMPLVPKDLDQLEYLEELCLSSTNFIDLPDSICMLKYLKSIKLITGSLLEKLPKDLGRLDCLENLTLSTPKIKHLPDSICMLKHLKSLTLYGCSLLEKLPEDLGQLNRLEGLTLSTRKIKHLPDSICMLKHLKSLTLCGCSLLEKLPEDLGQLDRLEGLTWSTRKIKHSPDSICMLKHLKSSLTLYGCSLLEKLHEDLGQLDRLEGLTPLTRKIKHLPYSICMLKHMKSQTLYGCSLLEKLPEDLGQLDRLERLTLSTPKIKHLPDSICMLKHLKSLTLYGCSLLEKLPEDLGQLDRLEGLTLSTRKIKHLPDSICMLKHLKSLTLHGCSLLEKLPEDLGQLDRLERLTLSTPKIKHLPDSICMLKLLKSLILYDCLFLEKLPEDIGRLECLEKLTLNGTRLEKLPEDLGHLDCLKELLIIATKIRHLPQSILLLKGLHIIATRRFLQTCGFTTEIQIYPDRKLCYVKV